MSKVNKQLCVLREEIIDKIKILFVKNNNNIQNIVNKETCYNYDNNLYEYYDGCFYYLFNINDEYCVVTNELNYGLIKQRGFNRINILNDNDLQVILNNFDENIVNCSCRFNENFYKHAIQSVYYENNKKNFYVGNNTSVYLTILKEAAGYDNSIGFYVDDNGQGDNIKKIIIAPTIKGINGCQIKLGTFCNTHIGFFIVSNGNSDNLVNKDKKIFYTNYELNDIETDGNEINKIRHIVIREKHSCSPNVTNYLLFFEDLDKKLYENGQLNSLLGFNNVQLVLTFVKK